MDYFTAYTIHNCKNQDPKVCEECLLFATCYEFFTGDTLEEENEEKVD